MQSLLDDLVIHLGLNVSFYLIKKSFEFFLTNFFEEFLIILQLVQHHVFGVNLLLQPSLGAIIIMLKITNDFLVDFLQSILIDIFD